MTVSSLSSGKTSSYMAINFPTDHNIFSLVRTEDINCTPKDKKLIQYIEDKIQKPFIATAESDLSLYVMLELEQELGKNIIWVTGPTFEQVLKEAGSILPGRRRRFCTTEMKMIPIFWYCYTYFFRDEDDSVIMNIGYRADEPERTTNDIISVPISCKNFGQHKQNWFEFDWRTCRTPLKKYGITKLHVDNFFRRKTNYKFPVYSNCVGCFNKPEYQLQEQFKLEQKKMNWFNNQETGKKRWNTYRTLDEIKAADYTNGQDSMFEGFSTCNCHD